MMTIGMDALTAPTRHGLADMFENTGCFTDHRSSDEYLCHKVHFRIQGCVVNRSSERSMFLHVLMHPSKRLKIRFPPRWISFPIQLNSNTSTVEGENNPRGSNIFLIVCNRNILVFSFVKTSSSKPLISNVRQSSRVC
ncbi:hypothetical protein TNCV_624311 [Trichonephila clavipes]|nr:hypothetical protein TNCV_624311 [Trichonephila clavipes]